MQARGSGGGSIYVAVVDDDESLRRSFSRLLHTAGFQPITYPSAEALLDDAKRPRFDCLVLDIQLEDMSGVELSRRLAAVKDPTPVVFITAFDDSEMQSEAMATGCAGFFRKTDLGDEVLDAIRRVTGLKPREPSEPVSSGGRLPGSSK